MALGAFLTFFRADKMIFYSFSDFFTLRIVLGTNAVLGPQKWEVSESENWKFCSSSLKSHLFKSNILLYFKCSSLHTCIMSKPSIQKRLYLGQKHGIVLRLANGGQQADIGRDYGVKKQAIGNLKENSEAMKAAALSNFKKNAKSLKTAEQCKKADELLFTWFTNMRSQKKNINGRLLLKSFKKILRHSGKHVPSDEACEGLIQRWREHGDIGLKGVHEENPDCPDFSNYLAEMAPMSGVHRR